MSVTLTLPTSMPVKWGSDFNAIDVCNPGFTPQYCQAVETADTTPLQVEIAQSGTNQVPITADWTAGANWVALDNTITHTAGSTAGSSLNAFITSGELHRVFFTVTGTTGSITIDLGGTSHAINFGETAGVFVIDASSANIQIVPTSAFDGVVTIISVENIESFNFGVTNKIINGTFDANTDWSLGTDWNIAAGVLVKVAGASTGVSGQTLHTPTSAGTETNANIFTGKLYKVQYTLANRTAGSLFVTGGGANDTLNWGREHNGNGTFTDYVVIREQAANVTTIIGFEGNAAFDGDIDNVTVFELANTQFRIEDCSGNTQIIIPDGDIDRVSDTRENVIVDWSDLDPVELITQGNFTTPTTSGTNTSTSVGELRDSGATFLSDNLEVDMLVMNLSDATSSRIVSIDSDIQLTLAQDIFPAPSGDNYNIWVWKTDQSTASNFLIISGVLQVASSGNFRFYQTRPTFFNGSSYTTVYTVQAAPAGPVTPKMGNTSGVTQTATAGTFTEVISNSGSAQEFSLNFTAASSMNMDDLSVQLSIVEECFNICVDTWDGSAFVEDNCTECYCRKTTHPCTLLFTLTNNKNAFGVDYTTASFTWSQRLRARLVNPRYPLDITNNKDNLGVINLQSGEQEKLPNLISDDWPEYVHDWISVMLIHRTWNIDAVRYVKEPEDYEPIWRDPNGKLTLGKSRTEVKKAIQKNINHNG